MKKLKSLAVIFFLTCCLSCGNAQEFLESVETEAREQVEGNDSEDAAPMPTPTEPPIGPIECPGGLSAGPPVGLACLHCAAPRARTQALVLANIMRRACRQNVATTVLLDGTFGDDLQLIRDIIETVTREGSTLHLYVYLSNGPWQRRNLPGGVYTELSGGDWSWAIQNNPLVRQAYADNIRNLAPVFEALEARGGRLYLIVGLEDNLSFAGARAVEALTAETMSSAYPGLSYQPGRNPCCGADPSIAPGYFRDSHNIRDIPTGGLSTNDGEDFRIEEIPPYIQRAGAVGTSFVYWTRSFQGLDQSNVFLDPAVRTYRIPPVEEQERLRNLID